MRARKIVVALAGLLILTGCTGRPLSDEPARGGDGGLVAACKAGEGGTTTTVLSGELRKEIDLLFVIDNSNSTLQIQSNLAKNFPKLIEALRTPRLNNKIPNVRIGITSTDLGAGSYGLPGCEQPGGDGGRLLAKPQVAGCVPPTKPWIDYMDGVVNINDPTTTDPIEKVKRAFQCIAELGSGGCGFEMLLEAARRALDPKRNVNPGFLRKDALLVLVFLTDEDDCSAKKTGLFDPQQTQLGDPLGPLTSFRCFEFGVQCTCPGGPCTRTTVGERSGCRPKDGWLHRVKDYVAFFKGLKPPGRVMTFAIAGPAAPVKVKLEYGTPYLEPSCNTTMGNALPAVRLKAFVDGFGPRGHFNEGLDASGNAVQVTSCSPDYGPALRNVGRWIVASLLDPCLPALPLTAGCGLACVKGEQVDRTTGASCAASCLHRAACQVEELSWTTGAVVRTIPRCASDRFYDASIGSCGTGGGCPCWRLVQSSACQRGISGAPYRLDVLRASIKSAPVRARCSSATAPWGGAGALGQCR